MKFLATLALLALLAPLPLAADTVDGFAFTVDGDTADSDEVAWPTTQPGSRAKKSSIFPRASFSG